jgi:hypothetical protein
MVEDLKCLYELFPAWTKDDLNGLYNDLGRNLDLVISRISEGHVGHWASNSTNAHAPSKRTISKQFNTRKTYAKRETNIAPYSSPAVQRLSSHIVSGKPSRITIDDTVKGVKGLYMNTNEEQNENVISMEAAKIDDSGDKTIDDEQVVTMPNVSLIPECGVISAPIVVLPTLNESNNMTVDPPLVNFPFKMRSSGLSSNLLSNHSQEEFTSSHRSFFSLDELFPDSIRKIRHLSARANGFY